MSFFFISITRAAAFAVVLVASASFVCDARADDTPPNAKALKIGDPLFGAFRYGGRVIAVPSGQWRLIAKAEKNVVTGMSEPKTLTLTFDEVTEGRLARLLEIVATNYSSNVDWFAEPCKTKGDAYSIKDEKTGLNNQFCTRVGFRSAVVLGASGEQFEAWARDLTSRGVGFSPEMPFVRVTRYTKADYLQMTLSFDPQASGIGPSKYAERLVNDWNASSAPGNPQHVRFYEALAGWAPTFSAAVVRAFGGDTSLTGADFGSPALPPK